MPPPLSGPSSSTSEIVVSPIASSQHCVEVPGPITFMPNEILEMVFFLARPGLQEKYTPTCSPTNVSQVCKRWRIIVLSQRRLWTTVVAKSHSASTHIKHLLLVDQFLTRSGVSFPLDIVVGTNPPRRSRRHVNARSERDAIANTMCEHMRLLLPVRHRWENVILRFKIDSPTEPVPGVWPWVIDKMPLLKIISVTYPSMDAQETPGILDLSESKDVRECSIAGGLRLVIAEGSALQRLTCFSVDFRSCRDAGLVPSFFKALREIPNLLELFVAIRPGLSWLTTESRVLLPKLRRLEVAVAEEVEWDDEALPFELLGSLLCPSLIELKYSLSYCLNPEQRDGFTTGDDLIGLSHFLRDSGCSLASLEIGYNIYYETEFQHTLALCPHLQKLVFSNVRFAENSSLFNALISGYTFEGEGEGQPDEYESYAFLPRLKEFTMDECYFPEGVDSSIVIETIDYMWYRDKSELRSFGVSKCNVQGFNDDPRIRAIRASQRYRPIVFLR